MMGSVASALAQEVIPDFYNEPGLQKNRSSVNQHFSEHIDPFTGALQLHYVDVRVPGNGGFDIDVVRSYNSTSVDPLNPAAYSAVQGSLAGLGWTIQFGRVLKKTTNAADLCSNMNAMSVADNPVIELPDGSRQLLAFTGSTSPLAITAQRWRADCASGGSGGMVVYSPSGVRYDMTQHVYVGTGTSSVHAWYTKKITDRNGNYATINYANTSSPEITSVTTSDNRQITFSYDDSGSLTRRISSITANGTTYNYDYQAVSGVASTYQLTSVTRPGGTSWAYQYNGNLGSSAGSYLMKKVIYPEGGTLTYGYGYEYFDPQANPSWKTTVITSKVASGGGSWSFAYAPGGVGSYDTTTVNTPSGTVTYKHIGANYATGQNGGGNLWKVGLLASKQDGAIRTETFSWSGQKISNETFLRPGQFTTKFDSGATNAPVLAQRVVTINGATYTTNYSSFDTYGNPQTIAESGPNGGSRTTSLTYYTNTSKWIVQQTKNQSVSGGVAITRSFDSNGNLSSITKDGVTTGYSYDGEGNVSSATFPRSLVHNYSSYYRGVARTESQPEGISLSRVVSGAGNVTSETNGESKTTGYGYDGLNRVTSISPPQGSSVNITYLTTSKTAKRGSSLVESTTYDGFGRPTNITLGGIARTYQYDALGRMTFASNPGSGSGTSYQYDIIDRVTRVTNADSTYQLITYGAGTKTVTDERSKATGYTYRSYGDPSEQFLMNISAPEASASIAIGRNTRNQITSVAQDGVSRTYGYNGNSYLTSVINPETGTTTYGRDAAGNMTSRVVGSSGTTTYAYDGQNRVYSTTYPGATPSVSQTYSKTNKLKTLTSSSASKTYGYDSNDNLTSESLVVGGLTFNTSYGFNGLDQLSSITYPRSGRVVSYSPDVLGRPTQVSSFASSISYWPSGQINQIAYANGTTSSYGQNARLWPSSFVTQKGSTAYSSSSYGYDGAGNLLSITDSADSSYNRGLVYDNINRLTSSSGPWGSGTIAYSGRGNITSQVLGASSLYYEYDGNNRLNKVSGARVATYAYDAYGDIVSGGGNTYTYDGAPNLTCVNCADTANKISYTYDGSNQRVTVTKAGEKTYEVYGHNGNLLMEYTPASSRQVEYIYLGNKRIAEVAPAPAATTLVATPVSPAVNQNVTLTASVAGINPTGTVTFFDGSTNLGAVPLASAQASKVVQFTTPGIHGLTAQYSGDGQNPTSTSVVRNVPVGATVSSLSTSSTSVNMNQAFTLTVAVTGSSPTGTVTFLDGATTLGTAPLASGQASKSVVLSSPGVHNVTVQYGGDSLNMGSTSSPVAVQASSISLTTTTLTAAPATIKAQAPVTLTATVVGYSPAGVVTFMDGSTTLGTANVVSGVATLSTTFATVGTHTVTASYVGSDGINQPSTGTLAVPVAMPIEWILPVILQLLDD